MTSVTGTTGTTPKSSPAGTSGNGNAIAGNFQQFLTLLTTQLQNQNPLDPLDTNQFTQQLVQFASVEQQLKTNDSLSSLLATTQASTTANAAGFVGLDVTADGSSATLDNGSASWTITPAKAMAKATVTIKDANGTLLADGVYTIAVSGTDASGQAVSVSTDLSGTVSAVDVSGATPVLTVNGTNVAMSSVKTLAKQ